MKQNFEFDAEKLFVVGIASSAGGLNPLVELISVASCHGSMSFVVVSHVPRNHSTELIPILRKKTSIEVIEIIDGMKIQSCAIYVIPPNRSVEIKDYCFKVRSRPYGKPNNSADVFFSSLAVEYRKNAIGVVLSGASVGADGSEGVRQIKSTGGHTYAQNPDEAQFPDMPRLALETKCIDTVASPDAIGHELSLIAWAHD